MNGKHVKYDPSIHHRHSTRLVGYDYSLAGAYFITLVTQNRKNLFGEIKEGVMEVNMFGEIVHKTWVDLPRYYPHITLDCLVLMPNHVHAIIFLNDDATGRGGSSLEGNAMMIKPVREGVRTVSGGETRPYETRHHGLPEIVRAIKSFSARRINQIRGTTGHAVWQRNYYDHVIRNQGELDHIGEYIVDNPRRWTEDKEYRG